MNKNKIIVLGNGNTFDIKPNKNNTFTVCNCQSQFLALDNKELKKAKGFLVLCELNWDDIDSEISNSLEFAGIRLVQRFIRKKMSLKAPVVFVSAKTERYICSINPENKIIRTPALKHYFVNLLDLSENIESIFEGKEYMTDTELAYTKLLYCDTKGLLVKINHVLEGRNKAEQEKYRKDIEHVLEQEYSNDANVMEEYHNTKDLSIFCKSLIARLDHSNNSDAHNSFFSENRFKTIKILLIEDEEEQDHNVKRFVKYIQKMKSKAKKANTTALFDLTVLRNPDDIALNTRHDPMSSNKPITLADYDVVISDIEICDDTGNLVSLGFDVIEKMSREYKRPLYYIVTNISRRFFDQIKNPYVRNIRLKEEAFGSVSRIETFLYGIKEVYNDREYKNTDKVPECEKLFNNLFSYINQDIETYNKIELTVKEKSSELIKEFLSLFVSNKFGYENGDVHNYSVFEKNCGEMREFIKKNIGLGNGNLDKIIKKRAENNQDPTEDDVKNFVVRLILRRFFLYVKNFIAHFDLMTSFEEYKKKNHLDKDGKITISEDDIACRAISEQYKLLKDEYPNKDPKLQSHCLDETLLFSKRRPLHLTAEEQAFVDAMANRKNIYPNNKIAISKLKIEY